MVNICFEYAPGQQVRTKLGDEGLVDSCSYSHAGTTYYVIVSGGSGAWYREDQLEDVPKAAE